MEVGGSPMYTMTEDYALGMELKKFGWHCRYVQEYLAIGEAPHEVRNMYQQRSRWTKASLAISVWGIEGFAGGTGVRHATVSLGEWGYLGVGVMEGRQAFRAYSGVKQVSYHSCFSGCALVCHNYLAVSCSFALYCPVLTTPCYVMSCPALLCHFILHQHPFPRSNATHCSCMWLFKSWQRAQLL